jgi:tetratricopeptide (TPR) repeat protein
VRQLVTLWLFSAALLTGGGCCASAEVIHLKNGRTIWAEHVRQNGSHVEYDIGDDSYAIPASAVERIEAGGVRPPDSSSENKPTSEALSFASAGTLSNESSLREQIVRDGRVDADVLSDLEKQGDSKLVAAAYLIAAKHALEHQELGRARSFLQTALGFEGQNPTILNYYAAVLIRAGNPAEAVTYAERAVRLAPNSPDTLAVLGFAQFASDHNQEAIRSWKRSVELRPDRTIQKFLDKAEREEKAESDFTQRESSHFTLRYEGKQTSESLRRDLVATLESHYNDLVRQLGIAPRSSILVSLYTERAFFDVTQSPAWVSAMNDGKLRIPIDGVTSITPELARVLKHELAHSFINELSNGRCPQWLNEGVAQLLEPRTLSSSGRSLAQLFQAQQEIPFNTLERGFMQFSPMEARLAYDQSLAAAEYISNTYGIGDLQRILQRLGQGSSTELALRATIHADYRQLQDEVGKFLADKYGL